MALPKVQTRTIASPPAQALRVTAVSLSRLIDYRDCPAKFKFKHLLKLKLEDTESEAMKRGSDIHAKAQRYVENKGKGKIPIEIAGFKKEFAEALKHKPFVEQQWAFSAKWDETDWFGKSAWCRIVVDLGWVNQKSNWLHIVDHKTGKEKDFHNWQMGLYALGGLLKYPNVKGVSFKFWYLDHGTEKKYEVEREHLADLRTGWEAEFKPMMNDTAFKPKPGNACRWCPYSKTKGGQCVY